VQVHDPAGYGALFLIYKTPDIQDILSWCKAAGREDDVILIEPGGKWRCNPLAYEASLSGSGSGANYVENVVNLFANIMEIAGRGSGGGGVGGGGNDPFWWMSALRAIRVFTGLSILATGTVNVDTIYRALMTAPRSIAEKNSPAFAETACYMLIKQAEKAANTPARLREFEQYLDYVLDERPRMGDKTRSSIDAYVTGVVDPMQRGVLYELFGTDTTFTPEACEHGKIIIVGLPVMQHGDVGVIANVLMKYAWQRSIQRRLVTAETRPVAMVADEAQFFVTSHDMYHQTVCRGVKCATVYLTQNCSNFYAVLGGAGGAEKGKAEADSLFANLNTKVFHSNGDSVTNQWAAEQIGRSRQFFMNSSQSSCGDDWFETVTGLGGQHQQNTSGLSEQMEFEVQPSVFTTLRTGGWQHKGLIDAIVYQSGRRFASTGKPWLPVTFQQSQRPAVPSALPANPMLLNGAAKALPRGNSESQSTLFDQSTTTPESAPCIPSSNAKSRAASKA
jgi:hypothetical protein